MKPRVVRSNDGVTKIAPDDMFVGQVFQDQIFIPEDPSRLRVTRVTFLPGGRTNWHTHALGQVLYVLSGVGRYQLEGGACKKFGREILLSFRQSRAIGTAPPPIR